MQEAPHDDDATLDGPRGAGCAGDGPQGQDKQDEQDAEEFEEVVVKDTPAHNPAVNRTLQRLSDTSLDQGSSDQPSPQRQQRRARTAAMAMLPKDHATIMNWADSVTEARRRTVADSTASQPSSDQRWSNAARFARPAADSRASQNSLPRRGVLFSLEPPRPKEEEVEVHDTGAGADVHPGFGVPYFIICLLVPYTGTIVKYKSTFFLPGYFKVQALRVAPGLVCQRSRGQSLARQRLVRLQALSTRRGSESIRGLPKLGGCLLGVLAIGESCYLGYVLGLPHFRKLP